MTDDPMGGTIHDATTKPVTEPVLAEALAAQDARWDAKLDAKLEAAFDARLSPLMEAMGKFVTMVRTEMAAMEARLTAQLRQHSNANAEDLRRELGAVDDKYSDLPTRVAVLERRRKR